MIVDTSKYKVIGQSGTLFSAAGALADNSGLFSSDFTFVGAVSFVPVYFSFYLSVDQVTAPTRGHQVCRGQVRVRNLVSSQNDERLTVTGQASGSSGFTKAINLEPDGKINFLPYDDTDFVNRWRVEAEIEYTQILLDTSWQVGDSVNLRLDYSMGYAMKQ